MNDKNYFPFYYNWADMINEYVDEDGDTETAQLLALAIVRYATCGEIMDLGNKHLQRMFEACLTVGVDAAAKHYQDGCNGGRPSKLTAVDQDLIADMRQRGYTAADVAKQMGVSEPTIKRQEGWKRSVSKPGQNSVSKPYQNRIKYQNQEEKEKEKEEEKENPASTFLTPSPSSSPNCPIDFDELGRCLSANHADQIMREYAAAKQKAREVVTSRPTDNSRQYVSDARAQELWQRFAADGFDSVRDDWVPSTRSEAFADLVHEGLDEGSAAFVVDKIMGLALA